MKMAIKLAADDMSDRGTSHPHFLSNVHEAYLHINFHECTSASL